MPHARHAQVFATLAVATVAYAEPAHAGDPVERPIARPSASTACAGVEHPDLGEVRLRDPVCRRAAWLGIDAAGVVVPRGLGVLDETMWVARGAGAWSIRLARWASVGGRHGGTAFSVGTTRLHVREHRVEAAFHPWATRRAGIHDRLALSLDSHGLAKATFDGVEFRPGGVRDLALGLGYGVDHALARRWHLGWHVQGRHAWVYRATQRHARISLRAAFEPRPAHRLEATTTVFVIHRDADQGGTRLPRVSANAQFGGTWSWMSKVGVGLFVGGRYTTAFMTGEAPMYELRSESLDTHYVEGQAGVRFVWR